MREKVEVIIAGKKYTIVGSDSAEYIEKLAATVDEKMQKLLESNSELTHEGAAVLSALNIADDYFKALDAQDNLREQLGSYLKKGEKPSGTLDTEASE